MQTNCKWILVKFLPHVKLATIHLYVNGITEKFITNLKVRHIIVKDKNSNNMMYYTKNALLMIFVLDFLNANYL